MSEGNDAGGHGSASDKWDIHAAGQVAAALLESAPDAVVVADDRGRIRIINARAEEMFGYRREELLGAPVEQLIPDRYRQRHAAHREAYAAAPRTRSMGAACAALYARRADGSEFPAEINLSPTHTEIGTLVTAVVRDVTERKRLEQAKAAADDASRAKSTFLANMSHEIRTPMNAIIGYTQLLLRDPKLDAEQRQYLEVISRSGDYLLNLVNDVLELSKIEAGHRTANRDTVDLQVLLRDIEAMFRLRAEAKSLAFEIDRFPSLPRYVISDECKLRQILVNLLGNAVKFTQEGGIIARLFVQPGEPHAQRMTIEIEDTGPGMGAEELAGLFKPFAQGRAGIEARSGTGLGLALSRELARLMGGDITVESTVGEGSVFRFELPIEVVNHAFRSERPSRRIVGLLGKSAPRVLVVDDHRESRTWMRKLLQQVGFSVLEAADGATALATFDAWTPHVVLMDLHMPVMDGFTAVREIRARSANVAVAIIAVTASPFDDAAIYDAGANGCVRKPCRENDVLEEIARLTGVQYRCLSAAPMAPVRRGSGAQVPPLLAQSVVDAARAADYQRLEELIAALPAEQTDIAQELRSLLASYAYEEIERRMRPDGPTRRVA